MFFAHHFVFTSCGQTNPSGQQKTRYSKLQVFANCFASNTKREHLSVINFPHFPSSWNANNSYG